MRIIEPHIHMYSRVTDDYEKMALAGIEAVVEPAFWLGNPRRRAGTFLDYFDALLGFENERAARYGIKHFVTLAMNPKESNDHGLAREVIQALESYADHPNVVGIGEIGLDQQTRAEEEATLAQLDIAMRKNLPVLIHLPHQHKLKGTLRLIDMCKEAGCDPNMIDMDHNTEETVRYARDYGAWCGHTVYPLTKLSPERAASIMIQYGVDHMMVNSSADWGPSDPLSVPRTVLELRGRGFPEGEIQRLVWNNPLDFFGQSGRFNVE